MSTDLESYKICYLLLVEQFLCIYHGEYYLNLDSVYIYMYAL